jgi:L-ascorbate metabolism protein UlaG (beta-lactamase superfamily)
MKITYVFHSGFVIETLNATLIFDYYKDSEDGFIKKNLKSFPGKLYVFSSHWHPDHFNKEILEWKEQRPDIQYIFSKDILKKKLAGKDDAVFIGKLDTWNDENVSVEAFGSTDVGVSFLIETEGKKIFHAGDLNNWHWDEESTAEEVQAAERHFIKELKTLANRTKHVDLAMFPVDSRLGKNYMRGAQQFIETIKTDIFVPMHFTFAYEEANAFKEYAEKCGCRFVSLHKTGENFLS